jgi:hypothetical protein
VLVTALGWQSVGVNHHGGLTKEKRLGANPLFCPETVGVRVRRNVDRSTQNRGTRHGGFGIVKRQILSNEPFLPFINPKSGL